MSSHEVSLLVCALLLIATNNGRGKAADPSAREWLLVYTAARQGAALA